MNEAKSCVMKASCGVGCALPREVAFGLHNTRACMGGYVFAYLQYRITIRYNGCLLLLASVCHDRSRARNPSSTHRKKSIDSARRSPSKCTTTYASFSLPLFFSLITIFFPPKTKYSSPKE